MLANRDNFHQKSQESDPNNISNSILGAFDHNVDLVIKINKGNAIRESVGGRVGQIKS